MFLSKTDVVLLRLMKVKQYVTDTVYEYFHLFYTHIACPLFLLYKPTIKIKNGILGTNILTATEKMLNKDTFVET